MLFVNPHQPWFGFGQFYEAHLSSGEGWNFYGATFFGSPLPTIGHNEFLGWTFTTNEPDVADVWRETFDDPAASAQLSLWRTAIARPRPGTTRFASRRTRASTSRTYHFLKTHHGPVVVKEDEQHRLSVRIGRMYESLLMRQQTRLLRARNLTEFKQGLELLNFPIMNVLYADREGNIAYVYNGCIPRRDPQFDWSKPVDGSDPAHRVARLSYPGRSATDGEPEIRLLAKLQLVSLYDHRRRQSTDAGFSRTIWSKTSTTTSGERSDRGKILGKLAACHVRGAANPGLRHDRSIGPKPSCRSTPENLLA